MKHAHDEGTLIRAPVGFGFVYICACGENIQVGPSVEFAGGDAAKLAANDAWNAHLRAVIDADLD